MRFLLKGSGSKLNFIASSKGLMSGLILRMLPLAKMLGILCIQERLMADCIKFTNNYS